MPCAGDCDMLVCIRSSSDDRCIPDATRTLARHASGRISCSQIARGIEGNCTDRPKLDALLLRLKTFESTLGSFRHKKCWFDRLTAMRKSKALGTRASHDDVFGMLEHSTCGCDRVADASHPNDSTDPCGGTVHQRGIEFDRTIACQGSTSTGIEQRFIFEHPNCDVHRIECRSTRFQESPPCIERRLQRSKQNTILSGRLAVSRSTMDAESNHTASSSKVSAPSATSFGTTRTGTSTLATISASIGAMPPVTQTATCSVVKHMVAAV